MVSVLNHSSPARVQSSLARTSVARPAARAAPPPVTGLYSGPGSAAGLGGASVRKTGQLARSTLGCSWDRMPARRAG